MLIHQYSPEWSVAFTKIKQELQSALRGLPYRIEHVGSTAVPHLASKPIIDVDIIYSADDEFHPIKSRLLTIGYYHNGNQGIEAREVFKRNGRVYNQVLDKVRHHLYVCPADSPALQRHLLFRDALRNDASARKQYERMKYGLAERAHQNQAVYADLKELTVNDFIDRLIRQ